MLSPHRSYYAVADLPTSQGPLTIDCPGTEALLLARPGNPDPWIVGIGIAVFLAGVAGWQLILRRTVRKYPGNGGPPESAPSHNTAEELSG